MAHVFISYSKQDIVFGRHLRQLLQNADIPVWMDETALVPSERWWRRIEENIRSCAAFIIIMSPNSIASDWVEREILLAEKLRKPIFPILLSGESWSRLANIQYVSMEAGLAAELPAELIKALKDDVAASPPTSVPPPLPQGTPADDASFATSGSRPSGLIPAIILAIGAIVVVGALLLLPRMTQSPPAPTSTLTQQINTLAPGVTPSPTVLPALPNLTVGRLRVSSRNPAPGQIFILSITLSNTGIAPSGAFNWSWDASISPPVMQNTLIGRVDDIPPNGSKNISFPVSYGWWGTYNTQLFADVDSEVRESDKRDNRGLFDITMGDLPFAVDFSLMPPNLVIEPPVTLTDESFEAWNLKFSLVPIAGIDCSGAALTLVDKDSDIVLQVDTSKSDADCAKSGIRVDVLRDAVGAALVELLPTANGIGSIDYYDSASATAPTFSVTDMPLTRNVSAMIGDDTDTTHTIRRFEVFADGGTIRITQIVMLRQTS